MPRAKKCKYEGCEGCNHECPVKGKCRAYFNAAGKAYYERNPEKRREEAAAFLSKHPNYKKDWVAANREQYLAKKAEWRANNAAYIKQYYLDNKEHIRSVQAKYTEANYQPMGDIKGYINSDGEFVRVRSMSEAYLLAMFDEEDEFVVYEPRLDTPMGKYYPDVYVPRLNLYVEVKGAYWVREEQMNKIEYLRNNGYSIIIIDSNLVDAEFGF